MCKNGSYRHNSPSILSTFTASKGDSACEQVFTVNDVSHGGCKYGIMNFSSSSSGSLSVEMCDNLYFTNRKVELVIMGFVFHSVSITSIYNILGKKINSSDGICF